jgi:hypothetical protein
LYYRISLLAISLVIIIIIIIVVRLVVGIRGRIARRRPWVQRAGGDAPAIREVRPGQAVAGRRSPVAGRRSPVAGRRSPVDGGTLRAAVCPKSLRSLP